MGGKSAEGPGAELTERDRFWLRHHEACVASGGTAKAYAKAHGISVQALYQWRKRRLHRRALSEARASGEPRPAAPRFAKVATLRAQPPPAVRYRVRLANGVLVEWEGRVEVRELETVLRAVGSVG